MKKLICAGSGVLKMGIKSLVLGFACLAFSSGVLAIEEQTNDDESKAQENEESSKRESRDDFSYSYIEVSFIDHGIDLNGAGTEPDGSKFELSLSLGDSLFGILNRTRSNDDQFGSGFDFDTEGYGFGFRGDSWFASYTYNTWELNNVEFDVDTIRVGFRNKWSDNFEFSASYTWNDFEDFDNENGFQVGLAYKISSKFDLVADYETLSGDFNLDTVSLGIRLNF
jgi:hypothetical protein